YYAWESYRAVRTPRYLLRENIAGSFVARSEGDVVLYRMERARRVRLRLEGHAARLAERLRTRLDRRLARREAPFRRTRYDAPRELFVRDGQRLRHPRRGARQRWTALDGDSRRGGCRPSHRRPPPLAPRGRTRGRGRAGCRGRGAAAAPAGARLRGVSAPHSR